MGPHPSLLPPSRPRSDGRRDPLHFFALRAGGWGVARWVLPVLAGLCLIAIVGWIAYWFGPVRRQRAALLALLVLACYSSAQGVAVRHRKQVIQQEAQRRFGVGAGYAALTEVGRPFP